MANEGCASRAERASATLQWDGRIGVCHEGEPLTPSRAGQQSAFQALGRPVTGDGARPYWTTSAIGLVPSVSPQAIAWEQEASRVTFDLDTVLLTEITHGVIPSATGALVWAAWPETAASCTPPVHAMLIIRSPCAAFAAERLMIVPALPAHDPLLHHLGLVLQATVEGKGVTGQLYAESLTDALAVHFLKRYAATRPAPSAGREGLLSYKLRRALDYIQAHLEEALPLATLAAVAQTSPAHFARLFKHATGLAPHQYVIRSRMTYASRLLAETDVSLIDIGLRVGCADQSHFTALFRTHVSQTPQAFRNYARRA